MFNKPVIHITNEAMTPAPEPAVQQKRPRGRPRSNPNDPKWLIPKPEGRPKTAKKVVPRDTDDFKPTDHHKRKAEEQAPPVPRKSRRLENIGGKSYNEEKSFGEALEDPEPQDNAWARVTQEPTPLPSLPTFGESSPKNSIVVQHHHHNDNNKNNNDERFGRGYRASRLPTPPDSSPDNDDNKRGRMGPPPPRRSRPPMPPQPSSDNDDDNKNGRLGPPPPRRSRPPTPPQPSSDNDDDNKNGRLGPPPPRRSGPLSPPPDSPPSPARVPGSVLARPAPVPAARVPVAPAPVAPAPVAPAPVAPAPAVPAPAVPAPAVPVPAVPVPAVPAPIAAPVFPPAQVPAVNAIDPLGVGGPGPADFPFDVDAAMAWYLHPIQLPPAYVNQRDPWLQPGPFNVWAQPERHFFRGAMAAHPRGGMCAACMARYGNGVDVLEEWLPAGHPAAVPCCGTLLLGLAW